MMKRILAVALALLMLFMTSCGAKDSSKKDAETTSGDVKDTASDTTAVLEFYKTDEEVFEIETSFCALKFPVKWKDYVFTSEDETDDASSVVFTAYIDDISLGLYTITIGEAENNTGYLLGTLKTDAGEKNVYLTDQYDEYCENLSEESKEIYIQMCEDVNVIISKLVYDNKMELS